MSEINYGQSALSREQAEDATYPPPPHQAPAFRVKRICALQTHRPTRSNRSDGVSSACGGLLLLLVFLPPRPPHLQPPSSRRRRSPRIDQSQHVAGAPEPRQLEGRARGASVSASSSTAH
ncbi:hypothetical protein ZWY2020_042144 [Hordeum vulgare]|nr:hypothetical protein ZWY2020_042144 [Hordeum vulgare]